MWFTSIKKKSLPPIEIAPLSLTGESHYNQYNRDFSISNGKINSKCWEYGNCVGIVNVPTPDFNTNYYIVARYNMRYLSVGRANYWGMNTCFSSTLQTNVESYGDISNSMTMVAKTSSSDPISEKLMTIVQVPAPNKYFHIQFGINSVVDMELYYAYAPGRTYAEVVAAVEAYFENEET